MIPSVSGESGVRMVGGKSANGDRQAAACALARSAGHIGFDAREEGLMTIRIAIFRAREDARRTAARLRRLGFSAVSIPAIEIKAHAAKPLRSCYDAVVASSAKAFLTQEPCDRSPPLYVVGARTGRAGEARGWRLATPPASDAAALIGTLKERLRPGDAVLYLAGRERKDAFETALAEVFSLEVVETYAADARAAWRPAEVRALNSCGAALHYSRRSAGLASGLARGAGAEERFLSLLHVCLSRDVAAPLEAAGAAHVAIAETPDEAGLFQILSHKISRFPSLGASRI
jgi:uroporphyrinogen-III synthase